MQTTYTKNIEEARLKISYDVHAENPRKLNQNVGHFITCEKKYNSPDDNEELKSLIQNCGDEAKDQEEHIQMIKTEMPHNGYGNVLAIYPVCKYEHSGMIYRRGTSHGFDYSNNGFYIITDKTAKEYGGELHGFAWEKAIDQELEQYTQWVNGEVYQWELFDDEGVEVDSGGDYYSLEDIRAELPEEWKGEKLEDYLVNYTTNGFTKR